jgi:thiamine-monophosphate kinase
MKGPRRAHARFDEAGAVALFSRHFSRISGPAVALGIGDDAAVLLPPGSPLVVTVDASVEGTHFERSLLGLEDVGARAFEAALSDLAAMGARPLAALSALTLPRGFTPRELERLTRGQASASRRCRCPVIGGNVAKGPALSLTTVALGLAQRPLTRSGAKLGDDCWLVGEVGLAAAGLALLRQKSRRRSLHLARCIDAWRRPEALLARGLALESLAHAAIDVSDGLAGDAGRLASASGCRLLLEEAPLRRALPRALVVAAAELGRDPLELALSGGEDYALVAAGPAARKPRWARRIGRFTRGRGGYLERADGSRVPLGFGFDHFEP